MKKTKFFSKNLIPFAKKAAQMPGKLTGIKTRWSQQADPNNPTKKYVACAYSYNKSVGLNTSLELYTVLRIIAGLDPERKVFIGKTATGTVAELQEASGATQIIRVTENKGGLKIAACEADDQGVLREFDYCDNHKGTAIIMALIPEFHKDMEWTGFYEDAMERVKIDPNDPIWDTDPEALADLGLSLCQLTNNMYYRTKEPKLCGDAGIVYDDDIVKLRAADIAKTKVVMTVVGEPNFFKMPTVQATVNATSGKDLKGKYSIVSHKLTEYEKKLVPTMAPWYITPTWVETEAKIIEASKIFPIPFRSLLLYGVSGTGKTEGAKAIFSALGLPAVSICCNVDMTMFDFLGQLLPNVNKYGKQSTETVAKKLDIPSFEDVDNDFNGCYKKLFGVEPDEYAMPSDCYSKITELMTASADGGEPDFIYVESEFVRAYRNGWGIEIQEPTIIKRNSVLAGLNKALDNDPEAASITLPTGEIVKRHPDCTVIMTTNQDYDGCNNIQQSVLSRMQNKRQIANPTTDELVERTVSETNFPDKKVLSTMAKIVREINDFCNSADVTDGVCGPRELANWAKRAYVDAVISEGTSELKTIDNFYVIRAAFPTIIEKVSQVSEDQEQVVIEVIQKHFAEGDVMMAKDEYMAGVA